MKRNRFSEDSTGGAITQAADSVRESAPVSPTDERGPLDPAAQDASSSALEGGELKKVTPRKKLLATLLGKLRRLPNLSYDNRYALAANVLHSVLKNELAEEVHAAMEWPPPGTAAAEEAEYRRQIVAQMSQLADRSRDEELAVRYLRSAANHASLKNIFPVWFALVTEREENIEDSRFAVLLWKLGAEDACGLLDTLGIRDWRHLAERFPKLLDFLYRKSLLPSLKHRLGIDVEFAPRKVEVPHE